MHLDLLRHVLPALAAQRSGDGVGAGDARGARVEAELEARVVTVLAETRNVWVWGVQAQVSNLYAKCNLKFSKKSASYQMWGIELNCQER